AQPATGTAEGPVPLEPGGPAPLTGFVPLAAPPVAAALLEVPEPDETDPLAELAGPTMDPARAGLLTRSQGGFRPDLFAGSDDRFLATLLGRLDAPLASRWAQILLQRALLTVADAPGPLNPADWVAARGKALAAIGSGADSHRLVSRIAVDRYTARLYATAAQAALAAGDPMALCPLSPLARALTQTPTWTLADAMCLAILGDDIGATSLFDRLRREGEISAFDIGLAERVASATGSGRRGANPEWDEAVGGLTAWRIGLASAAGLEMPEALLAAATPAQKAWLVRLPGQSLTVRAANAPEVAGTGAVSSAELNRILAADADLLDPSAAAQSPGGRLRTANAAVEMSARIAAMKSLWKEAPPGTVAHYGWQVATAPAAARIVPARGLAGDAPGIVSSLVSAGITAQAARWWRAVADADAAVRAGVWAQLVATAPAVPAEPGLYETWAKSVPAHRAQLLAAGLAGLGRGDVGGGTAPVSNEWTVALDRAVAGRRTGEVIVLTATGLQGRWETVHPDYLRRIAAALTAVGHAPEARLIVAEAANRG
ncbi:MAG: hypothetical protein ACRC1J_01155, partial [Sandaracinobacteroides sp.]